MPVQQTNCSPEAFQPPALSWSTRVGATARTYSVRMVQGLLRAASRALPRPRPRRRWRTRRLGGRGVDAHLWTCVSRAAVPCVGYLCNNAYSWISSLLKTLNTIT